MDYTIYESGQIKQNEPTTYPRKLTGSRIGTILGYNPYSTEYEEWLHMTKVKSKEFVGNKYTNAGNIIEGIIIDHLKQSDDGFEYISAEDVYGPEPYKTTGGDFYKDNPIFGGMWDALATVKGSNKPVAIVEIKTTKRAEDWLDGVPAIYQLQGDLYAYLHGVDTVIFPVAFLSDVDYVFPEDFKVIEGENYQLFMYRIGEVEKEQIAQRLAVAEQWWNDHILGGISPIPSDHKVDLELVSLLKTKHFQDNDVDTLLDTYNDLEVKLKEYSDKEVIKEYLDINKQQDGLKKQIRTVMIANHPRTPDVETLVADRGNINVGVKRTVKIEEKFDMDRFRKEHPNLYMEFVQIEEKETFRQSFKIKKEKENE